MQHHFWFYATIYLAVAFGFAFRWVNIMVISDLGDYDFPAQNKRLKMMIWISLFWGISLWLTIWGWFKERKIQKQRMKNIQESKSE